MLDIHPHIQSLLSEIQGVTVRQSWPQEITEYQSTPLITHQEIAHPSGWTVGNHEMLEDITIQIDIWTTSDTTRGSLASQVDTLLTNRGFRRVDARDDNAPGTYRKIMRYRALVHPTSLQTYQ